jgi:hypothetical protein
MSPTAAREPSWRLPESLRLVRRELLRGLHRSRRLSTDEPLRPYAGGGAREHRLVVALSCVPARLARLPLVLRSLLEQSLPADRVVVAYPYHSLRDGMPYPEPPRLPSGVDLLRCTDHGPLTKLLPVLAEEPGALIVIADDDIVYPSGLLAALHAAHLVAPTAALGLRGCRLSGDLTPKDLRHVFGTAIVAPTAVDLLMGTWGMLLPPGALDEAELGDFTGWPPQARWVDDVWISGHLARRGVGRLVVPARCLPLDIRSARGAALTFGINRDGGNDRAAIEAFRPWW